MTMRLMLADKVEVNCSTAISDVDCDHGHPLLSGRFCLGQDKSHFVGAG